MEILAEKADEESTYIVKCEFSELGTAFAPTTLTYTLTDTSGNVINSQEDTAVAVPTSEEFISLTGDDLAITETAGEVLRILTLEGTYTSAQAGAGAPFKKQAGFWITNLAVVA